ncbi:MAG: UDP-N-acetylmuramate dehydrogenase, partial [Pseudomonadota bacterium]
MTLDETLEILRDLPAQRGRLSLNAPLAPRTWFRVGGPAAAIFTPADVDDLAAFLAALPGEVPVLALGLASNTLVRDGGFPGVVIRLARGFIEVEDLGNHRLRCGTGLPDVKLAAAAAEAQIAGLSFYRGIPGSIGGALRMNAGAHGSETCDVLTAAYGVTRAGERVQFDNAGMGFSYRQSSVPGDVIFTHAEFTGTPGDRAQIEADMAEVAAYREEHQPTRERTGGSTFKNPPGQSAWKLVDAAGCRGLQ